MNVLQNICRIIAGIVFLLSGFLKALDPVGGALKIEEYLRAFHLQFFDFVSLPAAIILCCAEFVTGIAFLKGMKMRLFSSLALILISFFTLLTLYSAIFNPVEDCGCFGEAFHLSNWETFFKNIILFAAVLLVYIRRKTFFPIALPLWELVYTLCYTAFIFFITVLAIIYLPKIDFTPYKAGTDLLEVLENPPERVYETVFVYSKEGESREFTIDNLPDSTWSYLSSETKLISGGDEHGQITDFVLKDASENYVAKELLSTDSPIFFIIVHNAGNIGNGECRKIMRLAQIAAENGAELYIISGDGKQLPLDIPMLYTDYKTALSLNRSNGGLVYMKRGLIVNKWSKFDYPFNGIARILSRDYEEIAANQTIEAQLFLQVTLLVILFMVFIVRYVSKRIYWKRKRL